MNGAESVEARRELAVAEAEAWREYLAVVRGRAAEEYAEVEPWAWAHLSSRLRSIRARRGWVSRHQAAAA